MVKEVRQRYNEAFSTAQYEAFLQKIHTDFPNQLEFRVAETPIFVPKSLKNKLIEACESIIDTIVSPDFKQKTQAAIPKHQFVPNENDHSSFVAIDFAICQNKAGELTPQLIELQGFASLYAFQAYIAEQFQQHFYCPENYSSFFNGFTKESYLAELKKLLLGKHKPENVILLEIYPETQKTRIDFAVTKHFFGIEPVCYTKIIREGRQIFYEKEGKKVQIKRIYHRLIFDELETYPNLQTNFNMTDDVEVEWVGHPNWFFRISKYTLPLLADNPYVPKSYFLHELQTYPTDLENYVLKPLYSFAGTGVKLNITAQDLDTIQDRENYLIQRKVQYVPVIQAPNGMVKCEIRMLYIWHDDAPRPVLATNLARMSRGEMIGVRFNKDFDWVGGTVCFFEV
ncbi:MAG: hypothetical protein NZ551_05915 [Microscillaceae bacterium]|nr:hypothetical protein [Microscillaceae bacterium]MDW8460729.1 hypothetical protein [Cytophagales bacterium]